MTGFPGFRQPPGGFAQPTVDGKYSLFFTITIEILMAIYESLRIKDVVEFPLETRENPLDLLVEGGLLPVFKEGRYDIRAPFPEQR